MFGRQAATQPVLDKLGVSLDAATAKATMLALLVLGCRSTHEEIPFSAIQQALDIPAEQVEIWIIRAIGKKLLDGRIHQVRKVVSIHQCTQASFGPGEWAGLKAQLVSWRDSLAQVISQVAAQKVSGGAPGGTGAPGSKGLTQAIRV